MARIYVTGHRNPDTDSIASAIGYAELQRRLDPHNEYVPVRLGELNAQTRWVLERSGAREPELLPHVMLRVADVMRERFTTASDGEPVRQVGLIMAHEDVDLVPVVAGDGALAGVMTERALARRYVRESREASRLDAPTTVGAITEVLEGRQLVGEPGREVTGRVWVLAMATESLPMGFTAGDVVVVGDRPDAQRIAIEVGVALLVTSNRVSPPDDVLALARERETAVVTSPLDSYVTSRMITLSAPCRALMDTEPLVVRPDDLVADISETVKDVDYRAAVVVDGRRRPVGLVTRSDLVSPEPRRVLLVDHAEQAQSVVGVEHAEIVEILDHHHIGSIETRIPVKATFDPVGSTATLVIERFRQSGMEPSRPAATLLFGAVLSDTVILNSPTTTDRDRAVVDYLEQVLALDATAFGREMFESTSDLTSVAAGEIVSRDVKGYDAAGGQTLRIAQVETVGRTLSDRRAELMEALEAARADDDDALAALMVTDIMGKQQRRLPGRRSRRHRARVRRAGRRRRLGRAARRHEPQEAGRPRAPRRARGLGRRDHVAEAVLEAVGAVGPTERRGRCGDPAADLVLSEPLEGAEDGVVQERALERRPVGRLVRHLHLAGVARLEAGTARAGLELARVADRRARRGRAVAQHPHHGEQLAVLHPAPVADGDRAARPRDPSGLGESVDEVSGELERVDRGDDVEAIVLPRQLLHRADAQIGVRQPPPGDGDHALGGVDPGHLRPARRRQRAQLAAAAADVEHPQARPDPGGVGDRLAGRRGQAGPHLRPALRPRAPLRAFGSRRRRHLD